MSLYFAGNDESQTVPRLTQSENVFVCPHVFSSKGTSPYTAVDAAHGTPCLSSLVLAAL